MRGFTLLELLLAIVIIGVLAAIATPNLLPLINRVRGTEVIQVLSAALQAQQEYFYGQGEFADKWEILGVEISGDSQYIYKILPEVDRDKSAIEGRPKSEELKGYLAGIETVHSRKGLVFKWVICEAKKPGFKPLQEAALKFKKKKIICDSQFKKIE